MVVCAVPGLPTTYPVPPEIAIEMVVFAWTVVVERVCTVAATWVAPVRITTDAGGVTTFWGPAVPPDVRSTVRSEVGAGDALMTNVAGWPATTWSDTDWMVSVGVPGGVTCDTSASTAWVDVLAAVNDAEGASGGPMTRPAVDWLPNSYPVPCSSETVTDCGVAGVEFG